jgi:uncharacterized coiled-coil protein SlyX
VFVLLRKLSPKLAFLETDLMLNLDSLLIARSTLKQQSEMQISAQLQELRLQVATQLQTIQKQEEGFVTEQHKILEQLRPCVAHDARSLTTTKAFQAFVQSLFTELTDPLGWRTTTPQIATDPTTWHLHTLKKPVQVNQIDVVCDERVDDEGDYCTVYFVRMAVRLGRWQDVIDIQTETLIDNGELIRTPIPVFKQWLELINQLQTSMGQLSLGFGNSTNKPSSSKRVAPAQQALVQELGCLLVFVGELFNVYTVSDRLWDLQQ